MSNSSVINVHVDALGVGWPWGSLQFAGRFHSGWLAQSRKGDELTRWSLCSCWLRLLAALLQVPKVY
jgi:hypothetical protein